MKELIVYYKCYECGHSEDIKVSENCRKITCPHCGIENDFWLKGETPPANHQ